MGGALCPSHYSWGVGYVKHELREVDFETGLPVEQGMLK